jgi:S-ribosylhomocysteine lyase LuxS involved in autoinducer biosynthesis
MTLAIKYRTRRSMAQNGKRAVQDYDIRAVAPNMSTIYRSVVKQ